MGSFVNSGTFLHARRKTDPISAASQGWVATDFLKIKMKPNIHPKYREVAFTDTSIGKTFIIRSTAEARETITIDGKEYPQVKLDTSSESHPFYTGAQTRIVEAGRVEKFRQKFARKSAEINAYAEAAKASKAKKK